MIFAVVNQKGGVGKTTTVMNLGVYLASHKKKVLLIDFDPQSNLTSGLGERTVREDSSYTIYDCLIKGIDPRAVYRATKYKNLFILPADINLAGSEIELVNQISRETKLKSILLDFSNEFDYCLIDCPPSLGLLTINALVASDYCIIPVQCEYYALEGISQLVNTLNIIKKSLNEKLSIGGIVLTMYDKRTKLSQTVAKEIQEFFPDAVFKTMVPRNVKLSESPSFGKAIKEYDSTSQGAISYAKLAQEFIEKYD